MRDHDFTLRLIVNDQPGVLVRVAQVFARRGHNISSLEVSQSDNYGHSEMIISARGQQKTFEQIVKQLNKLIDVVEVSLS